MSPVPLITVIGSLNMDLVTYTLRMPVGGETLTVCSLRAGFGGKGPNQAIACARMSRRKKARSSIGSSGSSTTVVKMISAVGGDVYGQALKSSLEEFGLDTSGIEIRRDSKTGIATILVEEVSS